MQVPASYPGEHRTERLVIRPLTVEHAQPWVAFLANERAMRFYPEESHESMLAQSEYWLSRQFARYAEDRFGLMALHLADGTFVGQCGLLTQEIDGEQVLEIGYNVIPEHWGNGYATEAAMYFKDYAFQHQLAPFVISNIHVDNTPSQAVALRNGMQPWKPAVWLGLPMMVYRVDH
jgi:RimJ/RimL family protein N-acetyltransferase